MIHGILEDDNYNLWISTNNGFNKLNYKDNTIKKYDVEDGIQSLEFNSFSYHKGRSGKFYFGGTNGVTEFYPDQIIENKKTPPLVITEIKVNNHSLDYDTSASYLKTLELSNDQDVISIEYAALDYTIPKKIKYAYMMEGLDDDWIYVGDERKAVYTNLDPGEYVFRVKGTNNDGVWNEEGISINLIINPPFWATWWAYVIYAILFLGLLYAIREFEIRRQKNKARLRESQLRTQVAESESKATKAEIEKKNHELEEARKLQLSMLPKSIPDIPGLDIAVYMKTASEVGGDYYDFDIGDDKNSLTIAVGDATGHGLKAGTMVSLIKGLFSANASKIDIKPFYEKCTQTIKQMKLGNLYMALTLLKITDHKLIASSAGMPPIYVYKSKTKSIEEISLKGMPLGAFDDFPYSEREIDLESDDTILILTDGLPELFNDQKEILDYSSIESLFAEVVGKNPKEIISHLVDAGEKWANGNPQKDDMTFLVIKVR
jgi:serine phosphatase RsbU (regulator of sigma subunit)